MLYASIIFITIFAAAAFFTRFGKWWKRFLHGNMVRQYDILAYQICCEEFDYDEAILEIECFRYCWESDGECMKYVGLLKSALSKRQPEVDFQKELGI